MNARPLHTHGEPAPRVAPTAATPAAAAPAGRPLPKAPVLGWHSLWPRGHSPLPSVGQLPHRAYTTSGRAALLSALQQLALPPGSGVLVPTYHCPTMVAPVLQAGLTPLYFPIGHDGLPQLDGISAAAAGQARAMFVAHYFGLPQSLHAVRAWCDARGIALVEDCAHSYFGQAGGRPVGAWGDLATASLSKFFPVSEGGLLASAHRPLRPLGLAPAGLRAQIKGGFSVLEYAHRHGRLAGPSQLLAPLFWLQNGGSQHQDTTAPPTPEGTADADEMMTGCDMGRVARAPTWVARALHRTLPQASIVHRRRRNFQAYIEALAADPATPTAVRPLVAHLPDGAAPYVFPLWVDSAPLADALYTRLRLAQLPVFRWDRIWPGTPADPQDSGPVWSRQVVQLLCHQDLCSADIQQVIASVRHGHRALLPTPSSETSRAPSP